MKMPLFLLLFLVSCTVSHTEIKLRELDRVLSDRDEYTSAYVNRIDSLKTGLDSCPGDSAKWEQEYRIFALYRNIQIDSSSRYLEMLQAHAVDERQNFKTVLARVNVLIAGAHYTDADNLLSAVPSSQLSDTELADYYNALLLLYAFKTNDATLSPSEREKYIKARYEVRKQYISCSGIDNFERIRRPAIQLYEDGRAAEAIPVLQGLYGIAPVDKMAHAAYSLAKAYEASGDLKNAKYWFAQGAIDNLKNPSGEFQSLYELSLLLFDEHKISRAVAYSQAALEESLACNYASRINNASMSQLSIVRAAEYREARSQVVREIVIIALIFLCGLIFFFWRRTLKQSAEIRESSDKIREMNRMLEDAGKIKEGYVQRYIALSASYLRLIKEYRHDLRVTLKNEGMEEVMRKLRQPDSEILKMDNRQFYTMFDETFLGIYPDFIDKVNSLLEEGARFQVDAGGELPTELRILALIRLGIKDSGKIAQILNVAPSSVYTYRSRIKKSAVCGPDSFEAAITSD